MKIAYCGFDFFSDCLEYLVDEHHDVVSVFSASCSPPLYTNENICRLCEGHGLAHFDRPIESEDVKRLEALECDVILSAAYDFKIPDLAGSGIRGINIHPTLLPAGRGIWPLPWIILNGYTKSGVTFHKIVPELDAGDILLQDQFSISPQETLETLSAKVQISARRHLPQLLDNLDTLWKQATPQGQNASYWPNPGRMQRTINWAEPVRQIEKLCRAFGKTGCYGHFDGKDWIVYLLAGWPEQHGYTVGSVVHKTKTEMIVAASDGLVSLIYFQPERPKNEDNKS